MHLSHSQYRHFLTGPAYVFLGSFKDYPNVKKFLPAVLIVLHDAYDSGAEHHSMYFNGEIGCSLGYDPVQPSEEILAAYPHVVIDGNNVGWPGNLLSFGRMFNGDLLESKSLFLGS